jgi:hypothetical protein
VFTYLDAFCRPEHFEKYLPDYPNLDELKAHYKRGGLGDVKVKRFLIAILEEELAPIRARRKEWEQKIHEVYALLQQGFCIFQWNFTIHSTGKNNDDSTFSLEQDFQNILFHTGMEATNYGCFFLFAHLHSPIEGR